MFFIDERDLYKIHFVQKLDIYLKLETEFFGKILFFITSKNKKRKDIKMPIFYFR